MNKGVMKYKSETSKEIIFVERNQVLLLLLRTKCSHPSVWSYLFIEGTAAHVPIECSESNGLNSYFYRQKK